jgi:hypothetical protein
MPDDHDNPDLPNMIRNAFLSGKTAHTGTLFKPDDFNIYVNKDTLEAYIFHGPPLARDIIRLDYDSLNHSVTVIKNDGTHMDLGAKIQWLVRPYFTKAKEVAFVQTRNGEIITGFKVPLTQI